MVKFQKFHFINTYIHGSAERNTCVCNIFLNIVIYVRTVHVICPYVHESRNKYLRVYFFLIHINATNLTLFPFGEFYKYRLMRLPPLPLTRVNNLTHRKLYLFVYHERRLGIHMDVKLTAITMRMRPQSPSGHHNYNLKIIFPN